MQSKRGVYTVATNGGGLVYTKAVAVNSQAGVLEIHFDTASKAGWYELKLARGGYVLHKEGGMEWDALERVMHKYAWLLGEQERGLPCGLCQEHKLWRIPYRNQRHTPEAGWVAFTVYLCSGCGAAWEAEFVRLSRKK